MKILILTIKPGLRGGIYEATKDVYRSLSDSGDKIDFFYYGEKVNYEKILKKFFLRILDLFALNRRIKEFNPDIIHIDSTFNKKAILRDFFSMKIIVNNHKKFFILFHGGDPLTISKDIIFKKIGQHILRSSRFGVLSNEEVSLYKKYFSLKSSPIKFKYGVSLPSGNLCISNKKNIIFIARIIKQKGILQTIKAFQIFSKTNNGWSLNIIGDGPTSKEAKRLARNLQVENVTFYGNIDWSKTKEFYKNSQILVLPTYFPEGFPMSITNALRYGIAIVTTKTRGSADFLRQPNNCLWCTTDPENIAQKIKELAENDSLRKSMSKNNFELAKTFDAKRAAEDLKQIYNQILNEK